MLITFPGLSQPMPELMKPCTLLRLALVSSRERRTDNRAESCTSQSIIPTLLYMVKLHCLTCERTDSSKFQ